MFKKWIVLGLLFSMIVGVGVVANAKQPPQDFFGLRLGMDEEAAHSLLSQIATPQKEGKKEGRSGTREVWILKGDSKFNYLLTKFSKEHSLNWITVVAHPKRVRYSDIASLKLATKATDGINYSYKWKVEARKELPAFLIIARGSNAEFLTSYSVYPTR